MIVRPSASWKSIALNVRALAVGVLVATVLVTLYTLIAAIVEERATGGSMLMPPESQAVAAFIYSSGVAVLLATLCVPIWMLLAVLGLDQWYSAVGLGFTVVMAFWAYLDWGGSPVIELIRRGAPLGVCGAVAAFAVWWARPRA